MDWKQEYESKKVSAAEAISKIKSGDKIYTGHSATESQVLTHELCNQKDRFENVQIFVQNPLGDIEYVQPGMEKHFHATFLFANGVAGRRSINEGISDFISANLSEYPKIFLKNVIELDAAFVQVAPPNEKGECSFGIGVSNNYAVIEKAKYVIAEVNSNMPFTESATFPISKIDHFVESDEPIVNLAVPHIDEISEKIGKNIAELIPDRSMLQIGFGSIPNAVLASLKGKKDLGVHTEMFSDGVMELYELGVITSKYNNLHPGKMVTTYVAGSRELYDWLDHNPNVLFKVGNYTNDIRVAGRIDNLMSINSALQVDLTGQVNAEMIKGKQYSGIGGQGDFVKSAMLSDGGKSFIALPATTKGGTISKIVASIDEGCCVTTPRQDVQYVVTEYGVADLYGKTLTERAEEMINIAHPDFRDELRKSLKK
jgi:4-hydroxybutyrate CoA-transferase